MASAPFVQEAVARVIRAARKEGARVEIDLTNGVATIIPDIHRPERVDRRNRKGRQSSVDDDVADGEEYWG